MGEPASPPVQALPPVLDRKHLHFFVLGSGAGECVLVALPEQGWLVIDGCGPKKALPALALLRKYRAAQEPIDAVILTHPHADHYQGIVELLDDATLGSAIQRIGCVAEYVGAKSAESAASSTLAIESDVLARTPPTNDPVVETELGRARVVLSRIRSEWEEHPEKQLRLRHGVSVPLGTQRVTAQVLWPETSAVQRFFQPDAALRQRIARDANRLSAVLELRFGQTHLLLTGDLVHADANGKVLTHEGWVRLHALFPGLNAHHALKVPHHASREALSDELLRRANEHPRTWVVTPFNSHDLPSSEPGEGAERLLQEEREFFLTALPVGWKQQVAGKVQLTVTELQRDVRALKNGPPFLASATRAGKPPSIDPGECCWGMSFDEAGRLVARFRGQGARIIQRAVN